MARAQKACKHGERRMMCPKKKKYDKEKAKLKRMMRNVTVRRKRTPKEPEM